MSRITTLLLAVLMACIGAYSQQQKSAAEQVGWVFSTAISDQTKIGKYTVDARTKYFGVAAINDSNEIVFSGQFAGAPRGVYTNSKIVAEEGTMIDGAKIIKIINAKPDDVQINGAGEVAYKATIQGAMCGTTAECNAVFLDGKFVATSNRGTGGFYALTDDGEIMAQTGTIWTVPAHVTGDSKDAKKEKKEGKGGVWTWLHPVIPAIPIQLPWPSYPGHAPSPPLWIKIDPATGQPATQNGQTVQAQAKIIPAVHLEEAPPHGNCRISQSSPFPWAEGATAEGPSSAFRPEGALQGAYKSSLHPEIQSWAKRTSYSPGCVAAMVALLETTGGPGTLEVYSAPSNLVTYFDEAKGAYVFSGVDPVALPASNIKLEDNLKMTRNGCTLLASVLFKTATGDKPGLIIGHPKAGNCQ